MTVLESSTAFCLERVGRTRPGWDTLVVSGAADTTLPAGDLWAVWADLEHWPLWSPLHRSVTRTAPGGLAAGLTRLDHARRSRRQRVLYLVQGTGPLGSNHLNPQRRAPR